MLGEYVLRLGISGLGAWRRGRSALLDEVRTPMRVWPGDVDTYAHLNNGRFLTLMDVGRWELSIRTGLLAAALKDGWRPVVASCTCRFRRELRALQAFELVSAIRAWDEKYFYVEHRFEARGEVCAVGYVQVVNKAKGRTVAPAEMFARVGHQGPSPKPDEALARWMASLPRRAAQGAVSSKSASSAA